MPVVIVGDNLPSPVGIGLTDLPNIGEVSGPPSSGITVLSVLKWCNCLVIVLLEKWTRI